MMFGKAAKGAVKGTVATKGGRRASKVGAKAATKAAKGAGKIALAGGKGKAKIARQALSSGEPASTRVLKYGFFAVAGFAIGALVARAGGKEGAEASFTGGTGHSHPDPGSPAGRRGETWGSGTPLGTSGPGGPGPAGGPPPPPPGAPAHHRPGEPPRTGAERGYSDPSSGPLIGEHHGAGAGGDIPEQQEEVEQRIRTRVGEDPRTLGMQRLNVEVNGGVAEIRGVAPSEDAKAAVQDIASNTEGVREVRMMMTVGG
jgi:BON domain-containing protein